MNHRLRACDDGPLQDREHLLMSQKLKVTIKEDTHTLLHFKNDMLYSETVHMKI